MIEIENLNIILSTVLGLQYIAIRIAIHFQISQYIAIRFFRIVTPLVITLYDFRIG